jgi:hypothetical protein
MKRSLVIILLLTFIVQFSEAQLWKMRRIEAEAGFGPSVFFGDIGGFSQGENILGLKDISLSQTRFDLSLGLKYRITSDINARLNLAYGFLHATDTRGSNPERAFEASTSIFEPALIAEYKFIKNQSENSYLFSKGRGYGFWGLLRSLDFYVFSGIGGLSYSVNPNDKLAATGMTDTGGFTAVIPVGFGTTLIYSPDFNFGAELGGRYSFSDNLDGYTSAYSKSNDLYYFLNFTITYKLRTGESGWPTFK